MLFLDVETNVDTTVAECSRGVQERENANEEGEVKSRRPGFVCASRADAIDSPRKGCYCTRDATLLLRLYLSIAAICFSTAFSSRPSSENFFSTPKSVAARGEKSCQRACRQRRSFRGSQRSRGESSGGRIASRPRRARPRSDPAGSTRTFRCRVGCPRRTVTGHHATLHAARLSDQDGRRGARGFHLLVALEQEVTHTLAPLGRLAQVESDLLHSFEARERSLGHVASNTALYALHVRRVIAVGGTPVPRGSARDEESALCWKSAVRQWGLHVERNSLRRNSRIDLRKY